MKASLNNKIILLSLFCTVQFKIYKFIEKFNFVKNVWDTVPVLDLPLCSLFSCKQRQHPCRGLW